MNADNSDTPLEINKIDVDPEYRKKWNIRQDDFVCLFKNGELIRNTLYRVGGLGLPDLKKDEYFVLLKYVEEILSEDIMKFCKSKTSGNLDSKWCILDKFGNEILETDSLRNPYLVKNSCVYSIDDNYYNIKTGEFYCKTSTYIQSSEFLFLDNRYDKDKTRVGVMKINKKDGSWELFS